MNIPHIYGEVQKRILASHGNKGWFYEDYFKDKDGLERFSEEVMGDPEIGDAMSDDEIIDHITETLGLNITWSMFEQSMPK